MFTARDDRGRECGVAPLSPRQVGRRGLGVAALYDAETKREVELTGRMELAVAIAGGVVGAVAWQLFWMSMPVLGPLGLVAGFVVVPPAAAAIAWRIGLGAVRRRAFDRLAAIHLADGRCPACGYALAGLAAGTDGCLACPECGAAWRAERLGGATPTAD